jgi:hypothetical protein
MSHSNSRSSAPSVGTDTAGTTVAASTAIAMAGSSAFAVYVGAGQPSTTISWYASAATEGPYAPVVLSNGNFATTAVSANNVYISPPELFPCYFIKGVASSTVTMTVMQKG